MSHRILRTLPFVVLLVLVTIVWSAAPAGAASRPQSTGKPYKTTGQRVVTPRQVSTYTIPQVRSSGHGTIAYRPAPGGRVHVPPPSHVVRVPAPAHTNITSYANFEGQDNTGWVPSDSNGAGGTNNYLETVNEQFAIYTRAGAQQYETNFDSWFGQPSGTSLFDPVTQWDNTGKRFLFVVDSGSSLLVSVAQQTNALGNYCNYAFPTTPSSGFADFEKMGVNANGVYLTVNIYSSPFSNELIFATRTQMEQCQSVNYTYWTGLTDPGGSTSFAIVPAREDASKGVEYLVDSNPGGGCSVTVWSLTSTMQLADRSVGTQCYSPPPNAKQAGSSATIDTNDNRLYQAQYIGGKLVFDTHGSYDWGDGNGPVGIVEWFVLNASAGTVYSQGSFGTPGYWLFFPAAFRNGKGNMLFVFDSSGPSNDPSIWYTNQTLSSTYALATGVSYYGTSGNQRWGDYQSAWGDPVYANRAWITGQYVNNTNSWGTRVGLILP